MFDWRGRLLPLWVRDDDDREDVEDDCDDRVLSDGVDDE